LLRPSSAIRSFVKPRALTVSILFLLLILGGAACASQDMEPAPAFTLSGFTGGPVALAQLLKKRESAVRWRYVGECIADRSAPAQNLLKLGEILA
jgi:hypothetical protein